MNKKNLLIIIIAVVVVVGVVAIADWQKGNVAQAPAVPSGSPSSSIATVGGASTTAVTTSEPLSVSANASSGGQSGLSILVQRAYSGDSFSFSYPTTWSIGNQMPVSIDTFNSQYDQSGAIPMGGAEIDVATTTLGRLSDIMATELLSATNVKKSTATVDKIACTEAHYQNTYVPGIASENIAVYCPRSAELWKIYLSYRAGDQTANQHVADFNGVLSSMKFLP